MNDTLINEKSDTQKFWLTLIRDVLGVQHPEDCIDFEKPVEIEHVKFIDAYIPSTGIIIEQKSPGKDLEAAFSQAKKYYDWLPYRERGRYIITCDFKTFRVYDMDTPTAPPEVLTLEEVTREKFAFLIHRKAPAPKELREEAISKAAGLLARKLYKSIRAKYNNPDDKDTIYNLDMFCVRIVFLLYAEDSGLFRKRQFYDYLKPRQNMAATALRELFTVLNQELHERSPYLDPDLAAFPYVNGGLFEMSLVFPQLDDETLNIILEDMSANFDWSEISPPIFGAIFEDILAKTDTRGDSGIHYTSIENIHKVIDPLFLDELSAELDEIMGANPTSVRAITPHSPTLTGGEQRGEVPHDKGGFRGVSSERTQRLLAFQDKLAALRFLDPACGSGNFLTESFLSLRRMENKILRELPPDSPVKVSIKQFYGIEYNHFAVAVSRTALWISSNQMWKQLKRGNPLPLEDYDNIKKGDAMATLPEIDAKGWPEPGWEVPHDDMLYIMGNPPFLGYSQQTKAQKDEVKLYFGRAKSDYVACWFWKAAEMLRDTRIKAAFVATNSIVQGEQPAYVFKPLRERFGIKIEFAHQAFVWTNEMAEKDNAAHVHVVVIGFSTCPPKMRKLYTPEGMRLVENINFYLADGPDEDVAEPTKTAITEGAPQMMLGNLPRDGGNLIIKGEDYADFLKREPKAAKYIKRYMMGDDFINNKLRYCLWLVGAEPDEIRSMPQVYKRVEAVKAFRLASDRPATKKAAKTSWLFDERRYSGGNYVAIPQVSSERRAYIPMGWLDESVIPGDTLHIIPGATLYDFGVLTSRVHMAWMRRVCGRLEMRYRYSNTIVYNTFCWPEALGARGEGVGARGQRVGVRGQGVGTRGLNPKHYTRICETAQGILDARANHPGTSFAGLYDEAVMPPELRSAHERNDAAVCRAYGWAEDISEDEIVRRLFVLYHELSGK